MWKRTYESNIYVTFINIMLAMPLLFERIAFAIVPVEVRYPDRIVGIALLLSSTQ